MHAPYALSFISFYLAKDRSTYRCSVHPRPMAYQSGALIVINVFAFENDLGGGGPRPRERDKFNRIYVCRLFSHSRQYADTVL